MTAFSPLRFEVYTPENQCDMYHGRYASLLKGGQRFSISFVQLAEDGWTVPISILNQHYLRLPPKAGVLPVCAGDAVCNWKPVAVLFACWRRCHRSISSGFGVCAAGSAPAFTKAAVFRFTTYTGRGYRMPFAVSRDAYVTAEQ